MRTLQTLIVLGATAVAGLWFGLANISDSEPATRFQAILFLMFGIAAALAVFTVATFLLAGLLSRPSAAVNVGGSGKHDRIVRFERPLKDAADLFETYKVCIDGNQILALRPGQARDVALTHDGHVIQASVGGHTSPDLDLPADPPAHNARAAKIRVRPTPGQHSMRRQNGWLFFEVTDV